MEGTANSVEDRLIDGLSFKHKAGASYVTERKSVTYHPQGGGQPGSTWGARRGPMWVTWLTHGVPGGVPCG